MSACRLLLVPSSCPFPLRVTPVFFWSRTLCFDNKTLTLNLTASHYFKSRVFFFFPFLLLFLVLGHTWRHIWGLGLNPPVFRARQVPYLPCYLLGPSQAFLPESLFAFTRFPPFFVSEPLFEMTSQQTQVPQASSPRQTSGCLWSGNQD